MHCSMYAHVDGDVVVAERHQNKHLQSSLMLSDMISVALSCLLEPLLQAAVWLVNNLPC